MNGTIAAAVLPQRRARFQLHLCTLIVLSLGAGAFMLANSIGRRDRDFPFCSEGNQRVVKLYSYGFPYAFRWTFIDPQSNPSGQSIFFSDSLIVNCIVALITQIGIAMFCEWSLRRAERLVTSRRSE